MAQDDETIDWVALDAAGEALWNKGLAQELAAAQAWARSRLKGGNLDSAIKYLIVQKIGTLTQQQVQILQMQRTLIPFGVLPFDFVRQRLAENEALLTNEDVSKLGSPDLTDEKETEMFEWALTDMRDWLESQPDGKQHYQTLFEQYRTSFQKATERYVQQTGQLPIVVKAINAIMTIARAKRYLRGDFS